MISDLKAKAREMTEGIRFSLFIPIFIISLAGGILANTIVGAIFSFSIGYISDIFVYKFVTTGNRTFATAYEDYTTNIDNLVVMIRAGLRMFLYSGAMLMAGIFISVLCFLSESVAILIVGLVVLILVSVGSTILNLIYFFVPFILKDSDYKIAPSDAFRLSNLMTNGRKWEICTLYLSFIGQYLLMLITFGIYSIWATPYIMTTKSLYYGAVKTEYLKTNHDILTSYIDNVDISEEPKDDNVGGGTDFDNVEKMFREGNIENDNGVNTSNSDPFSTGDSVDTSDPFGGDSPKSDVPEGGESFPKDFDPFS